MSVTISTKVPEELADRIKEVQEEGESRSATVRRLIRAGLDDESTEHVITGPILILWLGSLAATAHYASATPGTGRAGIALMVIGYLLTYQTVNQQLRETYASIRHSEE